MHCLTAPVTQVTSHSTRTVPCPIPQSPFIYIKTKTSASILTTTPEVESILCRIVTNNDEGKIHGKGCGMKCHITSLNYCAGVSETTKTPSQNRGRAG